MDNSCIYFGEVEHRRFKPKRHNLRYRVFNVFLDVDELETLDRSLKLFSYNRPNVFSFYDRDHASGHDKPLRSWVEEHLSQAGIYLNGGKIKILCYPRIFGYVFNPISIFYCYDENDSLCAILYEVNNTFSERHTYLIPIDQEGSTHIRHSCDKRFYVSPFMAVSGQYHFRLQPPEQTISVEINHTDATGSLLYASFKGHLKPLKDSTFLKALVSNPLLTLKVISGIHWEALKLWLKGISLVDRPSPPNNPVTVVSSSER